MDFSFFLLRDDVLVKLVRVRENNGVGKSMKSLLHCQSINSNINSKYSKENKKKYNDAFDSLVRKSKRSIAREREREKSNRRLGKSSIRREGRLALKDK